MLNAFLNFYRLLKEIGSSEHTERDCQMREDCSRGRMAIRGTKEYRKE